MCCASIIAAPYLQDILLREAHILFDHISGLHTYEQRHQDEEERQHELKSHKKVAKRLSLHAGPVRTFQDKRCRLRCGIQCRSQPRSDCGDQRNAQHQCQSPDVIFQCQAVGHIRRPGSPRHRVYDEAGNRERNDRNQTGVQQLTSD